MASVPVKPQIDAHAVAPHSRPPAVHLVTARVVTARVVTARVVAARAVAARAVAALVVATLPASAAPTASARAGAAPAVTVTPSAEPAPAAPPPVVPPPVSTREKSYRLPLAILYTLAPFAAAGVGRTLSLSGSPDILVGVSAGAMFFTPAVLHIAHGKPGHGVLSFLALAGVTTIGTVVGGFLGSMITYGQCDPDEDSDGCDFAAYEGLPYGLVIGGVLSYAGMATYDVIEHGSVVAGDASPDGPSPDPASEGQAWQLWVRPAPSPFAEHAEGQPLVGGLQLRVLVPW
jgi:hypothetical protein